LLSRPEVEIRVYGFYSLICDLSFLSQLNNLFRFSADCLHKASGIEHLALRDAGWTRRQIRRVKSGLVWGRSKKEMVDATTLRSATDYLIYYFCANVVNIDSFLFLSDHQRHVTTLLWTHVNILL
jgi:hypothetical protein